MVEFRLLHGAIYIFENSRAERVKIGMTSLGTNNINDRLRDTNDKWLGIKGTCQICGERRLINAKSYFPQHKGCLGGGALPLERDVALAESHLEQMKSSLSGLAGSEKGSVTRCINSLEKRIAQYRNYKIPAGMWQFRTAYYTECAELVELHSHRQLAGLLDKTAPFGEVFCCSVPEAEQAVEATLREFGLLDSARKEVRNDSTSEKYGCCVICGGNLTQSGACPDCSRKLLEKL